MSSSVVEDREKTKKAFRYRPVVPTAVMSIVLEDTKRMPESSSSYRSTTFFAHEVGEKNWIPSGDYKNYDKEEEEENEKKQERRRK